MCVCVFVFVCVCVCDSHSGRGAHVEEQAVRLCGLQREGQTVVVAGGDLWSVRSHTVPVGLHGHLDLRNTHTRGLETRRLRVCACVCACVRACVLTEAACLRAWLIISLMSDRLRPRFSPSILSGLSRSMSRSVRDSASWIFCSAALAGDARQR